MSERIRNNGAFYQLLLTSTYAQQKALLDTLTPPQLDLISELVYNLLNTVPIADSEKKKLRRKKYFKELSDIKRSFRYRFSRVKKNKKHLLKVLETYADRLLTLL